jgi:hypothetical protein
MVVPWTGVYTREGLAEETERDVVRANRLCARASIPQTGRFFPAWLVLGGIRSVSLVCMVLIKLVLYRQDGWTKKRGFALDEQVNW